MCRLLTDDNAQSGRKPETNCDTKSNCDPRINCAKSRTYTHQRLATKLGSIDQAAVQNPTNDQQYQLQVINVAIHNTLPMCQLVGTWLWVSTYLSLS